MYILGERVEKPQKGIEILDNNNNMSNVSRGHIC